MSAVSERLLLIADWRVAHICAVAKRGGAAMRELWAQAGLPAPMPLQGEASDQGDAAHGQVESLPLQQQQQQQQQQHVGSDCLSACRTAPQFIAFATANTVSSAAGDTDGADTDANAAADANAGSDGEGYVVVDSLDALQNTQAVGALMTCALCGDDEVAPADMAALWCAHAYCKTCWRQWVKSSCEENAGGPLAQVCVCALRLRCG